MQTVRANAKTRHCTDEDLKMEIIEGDSISRYIYKNFSGSTWGVVIETATRCTRGVAASLDQHEGRENPT